MKKIRLLLLFACCSHSLFSQAQQPTIEKETDKKQPKGIAREISGEASSALSRSNTTASVPVICDVCNSKNIKINILPRYSIIFNNDSSFMLFQNINVNTNPVKPIKSIRSEISYFEFFPANENCLPCNKNSGTFGNINSGNILSTIGDGADTHSMLFAFSNTTARPPSTYPVKLNISLPPLPLANGCDGLLKFCIRYTITFVDCTVCSKVICYEKKIQDNDNINNTNQN